MRDNQDLLDSIDYDEDEEDDDEDEDNEDDIKRGTHAFVNNKYTKAVASNNESRLVADLSWQTLRAQARFSRVSTWLLTRSWTQSRP